MNLELSELQQVRQDKADHLRTQGIDPYSPRSQRTHSAAEALAIFVDPPVDPAAKVDPLPLLTVAGRVTGQRHMGKTIFAHLRDGSGQIQIYLRKDELGEEPFASFLRAVDLGDFIQATGTLFRTKTGEVTLKAQTFLVLTKALNAPPEKWHGLQDIEQRFRQRYVDLIANETARQVFVSRARIVTAIRRYLDDLSYLEVETPTLQTLYGGAAARPFTTHHHALDQTFYLRIADELYLKRLIVGGYDRVYEICKDFRNEGVDRNHSPEFTMLEFYEAYADYTTMRERLQGLVIAAANAVHSSQTFVYQEQTIDLAPPWASITLRDAIFEKTGIDYVKLPDQPALLAAARAAGADIDTGAVWPRIVDELLKQFVRPYLVQPTFLIDYPVELSPLARRIPGDPTHAERFQLYLGGGEIANAFTELNDPLDQWARFVEQQQDLEAGDEEAMPVDEDYVNALMYGMPPTGGVGMGIDRLTMILTDQPNIREVILFPAMRRLPAPGSDEPGNATDLPG